MKYDQFITKVAGRADVSFGTAEALTAATLQALAERISGGEAAQLAKYIPEELKPHLTGAEEPAQRFGSEEFVRRVAERAGTGPERAEAGIRAVFATLREETPREELEDVLTQLPKEYARLVGAKP
ncbi:DUF2267 domain-containing protein [Terrabacter sp. BE26]|uniref:DUF2267 domain-containing protein n=1 Tax=Terrabacter sp. BE26 TaxID=2898152 RepID=UPI0035BE93EA